MPLKLFANTTELLKHEPALASYYTTGQSDFSNIITTAKENFANILKSRGETLRNILIPLTVTTTSWTEDNTERMRLVVDVTSKTNTPTVSLYGTNDSSETGTGTLVTTLSLSTTGENTVAFTNTYKYYKVVLTGTAVIASYKLYETVLEYAFICLCISKIYETFTSSISKTWNDEAKKWWDQMNFTLDTAVFSRDSDEDEEIDEDEINKTISIRMLR